MFKKGFPHTMLCSHDRGIRFTSAFGQVLAATQHFGVSPAVHENSPNVAFKSVFVMDLRGASLILCLLLLVSPALQQTPASAKKKNARKGEACFLVISEEIISLHSTHPRGLCSSLNTGRSSKVQKQKPRLPKDRS